MYVRIKHKIKGFKKENFKKYTEVEFINLAKSISQKIGVDSFPEIHFYKEGPPGQCITNWDNFGKPKFSLGFNKNTLTGDEYTIHQLKDIIKHEFAHMIANQRYNVECGHDERWKNVAIEIGYEPSETLPIGIYNMSISIDLINNKPRPYYYYLLCRRCGKIIIKTNNNPIQFFLLSCTNLPASLNGLASKTICCNSIYVLEASVGNLLADLKRENILEDLQEILRSYL